MTNEYDKLPTLEARSRYLDAAHHENGCRMRRTKMEGWTVELYDAGPAIGAEVDDWGKTPVAVVIVAPGGATVYATETSRACVFVPRGDAIDSDRTLYAAIRLICHEVTHDRDDGLISCEWPADELADIGAAWEADDAEDAPCDECGEVPCECDPGDGPEMAVAIDDE